MKRWSRRLLVLFLLAALLQLPFIYRRHRLIYAYDSPEQVRILTEKHELDGGTVLPGFRLSLADLFASFARPSS